MRIVEPNGPSKWSALAGLLEGMDERVVIQGEQRRCDRCDRNYFHCTCMEDSLVALEADQ